MAAVGTVAVWGSNGAIVVASIVTAAATAVLSWFTAKLVNVTRTMASEPAIVPALAFFASNVFLEMHNAGDGAAVDIDVTIRWEVGANVKAPVTTSDVRWRAKVLPAGGRVRFNPPPIRGGHMQADILVVFERVSVNGHMYSSRGERRAVSAAIEEPGELYDYEVEARRQYSSNYEPVEVVADEMRKITKLLERWSPTDPMTFRPPAAD